MVVIYGKDEVDFGHLGLGTLSPSSCKVSEELNGLFELEMKHAYDAQGKWRRIEQENIVVADTPKGKQPFRIYHISPNMKDMTVKARHLFYDLLDNLCLNVNRSGTAQEVMAAIQGSLAYTTPFTFSTDITLSGQVTATNQNPINVLIGDDSENPSFLAIFGGEIKRDWFSVEMLSAIGEDSGVSILYGKNLIGLEVQEDLTDVGTRIYPVGKDGYMLSEKYVDSLRIGDYANPKIRVLIDERVNTRDGLLSMANGFFDGGGDLPAVNINVDFQELSQTEEYKDFKQLQTIYLGDTVTVINPKMGFSRKSKVISYQYDCLAGRYTNIELGSFVPSISSAITNLSGSVANSTKNNIAVSSGLQETNAILLSHVGDFFNPHLTNLSQVGFLKGSEEPAAEAGVEGDIYLKYGTDGLGAAMYSKIGEEWKMVLKGLEAAESGGETETE